MVYEMPNIITIDMTTGETVTRELTPEEIAALPQPEPIEPSPE
jgi:hypothetical protein